MSRSKDILNISAKPRLLQSLALILLATSANLMAVNSELQTSGARLELLSSPASSDSSLSRIVTDAKGQVWLSWVTQKDQMSTLKYSKLKSGGWSVPKTISQGDDWFNNWADFPSLVVNESSMAAHWLRMSADGAYDYDIQAAFFDTDQDTWTEGVTIHKDGISAEHGFVSMQPMSNSLTFISWLDGRETRADESHESASVPEHHSMGAMTLRAGVFGQTGEAVTEWELDNRVCDCCQTSAAMSSDGPIVVYRDRSNDEVRDIYITRYVDSIWTQPKAVYNDGWKIAGCPVNGPDVAATGNKVAVSWFTAKDDQPEVKLVLSGDGGKTFSPPVVVADGNTNGRVGTVILDSGNIAVSWMDKDGSDAKIMLSLYSGDGTLLETIQVAKSKASRRSGFPVIDSFGNTVYVTWTNIDDKPQVMVARVTYFQ